MPRRPEDELIAAIHHAMGVTAILWERMTEGAPSLRRSDLPTADEWIARCRAAGDSHARILAGVEQALNDLLRVFLDGHAGARTEQDAILAHYRARTGRYLFDDAPDPRSRLRGVLDRGRLRSETEWYLVTAVLSDTDQRLFDRAEAHRLGQMLLAWERARRSR